MPATPLNAPDPVDKYPGLNRGIYMLVWQMSGRGRKYTFIGHIMKQGSDSIP